MNSKLTIPEKSEELPVLVSREELAQKSAAFFARGLEGAVNTQRAYRSDLNQLRLWLAARELGGLPLSSATLAAYLSDEADHHAWATLSRRLAALRKWHKLIKHPDPALDDTVQTVLEGIKRTLGTEPGQAPAFEIDEFKAQIRLIPLTPAGLRDRALLLVGFVGAFRRSELVALDVEGIQFTREGTVISYRGSKTNQYARTEQKGLFFSPDPDTCPVRALQDYLALLGRQAGPLFVRIRKKEQITEDRLSDKQVALLRKGFWATTT